MKDRNVAISRSPINLHNVLASHNLPVNLHSDEEFNKNKRGARAHVAKMARNIDPNEEEPTTLQEAINHSTRGK